MPITPPTAPNPKYSRFALPAATATAIVVVLGTIALAGWQYNQQRAERQADTARYAHAQNANTSQALQDYLANCQAPCAYRQAAKEQIAALDAAAAEQEKLRQEWLTLHTPEIKNWRVDTKALQNWWQAIKLPQLEAYIHAGADLHAKNTGQFPGDVPLHWAAGFNTDPAIITALIAAGTDVQVKSDNGEVPLHKAARHNVDPIIITTLITAGADVQAIDDRGDTPVLEAARRNPTPAITAALIAAGAEVQVKDERGNTPLHEISHATNLIICRYSPHFCAEIKLENSGNNSNPAIVAALLAAGADIQAKNNASSTPLHVTAKNNPELAITAALIKGAADVRAKDDKGNTPLHEAAFGNTNPAIIAALVTAGADITATDNTGDTPLHEAARANPEVAIIDALVTAAADIPVKNANGRTPLHEAARNNPNPDVIAALVTAGADVQATDNKGNTPLHWAAFHNANPAIIAALITAAADVQAKVDDYIPLDFLSLNDNMSDSDKAQAQAMLEPE